MGVCYVCCEGEDLQENSFFFAFIRLQTGWRILNQTAYNVFSQLMRLSAPFACFSTSSAVEVLLFFSAMAWSQLKSIRSYKTKTSKLLN